MSLTPETQTVVHAQNRMWRPLCAKQPGAVTKRETLVTCEDCGRRLAELISNEKVRVEMGLITWPLQK